MRRGLSSIYPGFDGVICSSARQGSVSWTTVSSKLPELLVGVLLWVLWIDLVDMILFVCARQHCLISLTGDDNWL